MAEWADRGNAKDYFQQRSVHCMACGKNIALRAWVVIRDKGELIFCEPDCERLFQEYCVPRYGAEIRWR